MKSLLSSSCRVAFAALIHDLGKLAQRAKLPISKTQLDAHKTLYCPFQQVGGYHSHVHAAYTGYALDQIENYLPDLIQNNTFPFASRHQNSSTQEIVDSLINAAAAHHKPDTLLQWIIATADRVASGFEREAFEKYNMAKEDDSKQNHYTARLLSLFEQIKLSENMHSSTELKYAYPLQPMSAESIYPKLANNLVPKTNEEAQAQYFELWQKFVEGLAQIPTSHKQDWSLWLDHFDTAYQAFTSCIPSATAFGVKPDVSLYDHSKTTAALATALWRWHEENQATDESYISGLKDRKSWEEDKFLLIQGDFFGIQDFIFSGGRASNKQAAKLLRGRSFQVSLFSELAALKVLQACELPSTSQVLNAAGKFLIVAPNTEKVRQAVENVQKDLNQWFVEQTYGLVGVGLATTVACCNDFIGNKFSQLLSKLFAQLESIKLQRLDLTDSTESVQEVNYPYGVCELNHYFPAISEENKRSIISQDQVLIGEQLVKKARLMICDEQSDIFHSADSVALQLSIFGYRVIFTQNQAETGKFGELVKAQQIYRFWDFSIPDSVNQPIWNGYARRYINTYVALFKQTDNDFLDKYKNIDEENHIEVGKVKTFDYLCCEDRQLINNKFIGQSALMTLKGDVDNLGLIFQKGLQNPSFAKMATLSRQMNQFFSLWLPAYSQQHKLNVYTVFAGGDDFFLIGSWRSVQRLADKMRRMFADYVAQNPEIHFSAGMVMSKVGIPVPRLGELAEVALEKAKEVDGKNAVTLYNRSISWRSWQALQELEDEIDDLSEKYNISTAYLYSLIHPAEQAEKAKGGDLQASMWRSRFSYKTVRYVVDKLEKSKRESATNELLISLAEKGIAKHQLNIIIPLFNYLYSKR